MADTEVVGSVASEDGVTWTLHLGNAATGLKGDTKYKVRPVGAELEVTTLEPMKAPARVSDPVLAYSNTTLGTTFTRQSPGAVTANPPAEMDPPLWQWRPNSATAAAPISGASGETLTADDATFDVGHQIRTGTRFFNDLGNGQEGEITLWSPWVTLTELQAITAPTSAITQGEQAIVSFNTLPDTVTITQSGVILPHTRIGVTNSFNFTPLTADKVFISATKTGYSPYAATWTVQPAAASLSTAPQNIFRVDLTEPETLTLSAPSRYAGDYVIDPAATGPQILGDVVLRTVSGNPAKVGEEVIVDVGPVASQHPTGLTLDISVFAGAEERTINGNSYTPIAADAGKTLTAKVIAFDASGFSAEVTSNSLTIQVPTPTDTFTAANGTTITQYSGTGESGRHYDTLGAAADVATIQDGHLIAIGTSFVSTDDDVADGYTVTAQMVTPVSNTLVGHSDRGAWPAVGITAGNTGFHFRNNRASNEFVIIKVAAGTITAHKLASFAGFGTNAHSAAYTVSMTVTPSQDGTTATCVTRVNGTEVPGLTFSDPSLLTGKAGSRMQGGGTVEYNKINTLAVEPL